MTISIPHGAPQTPFFIIAQPRREYKEPRIDRIDTPIIELTDPVSKDKFRAELVDICTVHDEESFNRLSVFSLMAYGLYPHQLKPDLIKRYPQMKDKFEIEYWILKRL